MKLGLVQIRVSDDLQENLKQALEGIEQCAIHGADLIALPELWNTPFDNSSIVRHDQDFHTLLPALAQAADRHRVWLLAGTLPIVDRQDHKRYNRAVLFDDHGKEAAYADKLHLLEVRTARHTYREADVLEPGRHFCRVSSPWGQIAVCICYDIRFPELARLLCEDAFLLMVPAGFNDKVGPKHWQPLLQARAIENEVFVAGINPAAQTYANYGAYGHSMVISPDGKILMDMGKDTRWQVVEIDERQPEAIRCRSPFWALRRQDLYKLEENETD